MKKFHQLVDYFIETGELGDYNPNDLSITLYDIANDKKTLSDIQQRIESITKKYKFIVVDNDSQYTNIKILNIEL